MRRRLLTIVLLSVALFALSRARMAHAREPSVIVYTAHSSCPDRSAFVMDVRRRTSELQEDPNANRRFTVMLSVDVERDGAVARARGTLVVERGGRRGSPRTVEASTCEDAARAIATP